jgi:uncharacterized repeat protein (TIGR01451 family)
MTRLVKGTIRRVLLVGVAISITAISGLLVSASGQTILTGASSQVFKSDTNRTFLGNLTADTNFSDKVPVTLTVNDKLTNPSSTTAEVRDETVAAPARPNVALLNSVMPSGTQPTGTDLVFTVAFTNSGGQAAQVLIVVDPIPAETDFKLNSPTAILGTTGMTAAIEFSNDNAATWTYTPTSGGGGALDGYDRLVTHVRWRFNGSLSQTFPDNGGSVAVTARIQ